MFPASRAAGQGEGRSQGQAQAQALANNGCNVTSLPRIGVDSGFIGQMRRVNTSQTDYAYFR
jgi:hypothetical protein